MCRADIVKRRQAAVAATMQVFETAELLEMILLEVDDVKTVLLSQRTRSTFKDTITSSVKLQRMLWLLPPIQTPGPVQINPFFLGDHEEGFIKPTRVPFAIQKAFWDPDNRPYILSFQVSMLKLRDGSWRGMTVISRGEFNCFEQLFGGSVDGKREDMHNYEADMTAGDVVDRIKSRIKDKVWGWPSEEYYLEFESDSMRSS